MQRFLMLGLFSIVSITSSLLAEEEIDILFLNDGEKIEGFILESGEKDTMEIESLKGNIYSIPFSDIKSVAQRTLSDNEVTKYNNVRTLKKKNDSKPTKFSIDKEEPLKIAQNWLLYSELKKSPSMAVFLTWLWPGLGHFYTGSYISGTFFFSINTFLLVSYINSDKSSGFQSISLGTLIISSLAAYFHAYYMTKNYNKLLRLKLGIKEEYSEYDNPSNKTYNYYAFYTIKIKISK